MREFVATMKGKISIFILPPYAPGLNPDELVWNYIRQTGTARSPLMKSESLLDRTFIDLELIAQDNNLIKSFFLNESVSFFRVTLKYFNTQNNFHTAKFTPIAA